MARATRSSAAAAQPAPAEQSEQQEQHEDEDDAMAEADDQMDVDAAAAPSGTAGPSNSLKFADPLSWKPGHPITVATLHNRLKKLWKELQELEQEDVDRPSLETPAKELAGVGLLQHKDNGVRAFLACCLADMLRLHAPDAPYTAGQLKEIFQLFVNVLKGLDDTDQPYYEQSLYLLDSLSTVKSVVLISDIPNSDQITLQLFTTFFDLAKPDGRKNVEYHMCDILVQIIDECQQLPQEVVDIILAQFLRPIQHQQAQPKGKKNVPERERSVDTQTKLISSAPPPAYVMAKSICKSCEDKMARRITQYFSEVILDNSPIGRQRKKRPASGSPAAGEEEDEEEVALSHEQLKDLGSAHQLVKELWKACPGVLQNVIPQMEQELLAENADLREMATETIGDMMLNHNFLTAAPATWRVWIGRHNDKKSEVRAKWVEAAVRVIRERNDLMAIHLTDFIAAKLNDLDEKVRYTACKALRTLDYESVTSKLGADNSPFNVYESTNTFAQGKKPKAGEETRNWGKRILSNLGERARDKKLHVRLEGMRCLARMWDMAYKDIAAGNDVVIQQLGWIPSKILDTFYINDADVNVLLDHVLHEILLPVNYPPIEKETNIKDGVNGNKKGKGKEVTDKEREKEALEGDKIRVQRLLVLVKGLDPKARRALFAVPLRQISYGKVMEVFLKACEDFNGGVIEEGTDEVATKSTLDKFSTWLSQKLPEPVKAKENLSKFAKLHDRRCYQLIRFCFSAESDYRTVVRALKEIKKRIGDSSMPAILDSLTPLLYRVSQLVYNKSHVAPIVEFSRTDELGLGQTAHEVLKEMSGSNPAVFKANVKALSDLLQEQVPGSNPRYPTDPSTAVDTLKACAGFAKSYPKDMPQERKLLQALMSFALTGTPPAAAKHAVTILMYSAARKEMYAADLINHCTKDFEFGTENFLAKLACLGQLVLLAPDQCEEEASKIIDIARDVLLKVRSHDGKDKREWCEDSELDEEIQAKLLALRILVNRLRAHTDQQSVENIAGMVMKVLITTIVNEGELSKNKDTPNIHRSRLRLAAAQLLLKLAMHKAYDDLITPIDFNRLACCAQDRIFQVRAGFIKTLRKYLAGGKLPPRYYTIIFLMAFEPEEPAKEDAVTWIKARTHYLQRQNQNVMEGIFARLLSLLTHHPDFGTQVEDAQDFAKYILFYLTSVANADNLSLIYYVAQRVKQFRDKLSENSDNLYYVSELAQAVIKRYADLRNWPIQTWPGRLRLPGGLFAPMQSAEESQAVAHKTFLPPAAEEQLDGIVGKSKITGKKRAKRSSGGEPSAKRAKKEKKELKKRGRKKKEKAEAEPSERRRSGRAVKEVKYVEADDEEEERSAAESGSEESESESESESEEEVEAEDERSRTRLPPPTPQPTKVMARGRSRRKSPEPEPEPEKSAAEEEEEDTEMADAPVGEPEDEPEPVEEEPKAATPAPKTRATRGSARKAASTTDEVTSATTPARPTRRSRRGEPEPEEAPAAEEEAEKEPEAEQEPEAETAAEEKEKTPKRTASTRGRGKGGARGRGKGGRGGGSTAAPAPAPAPVVGRRGRSAAKAAEEEGGDEE